MQFKNSNILYEESLKSIPMGTSTFSKNPNLYTIGAAPLFIDRAKGCRVFDVDGNEFIDYSMALCIVILGYANQEVNKSAYEGIEEGLIYGLSVKEESELANKLIELIPCAEMVRFSKNGSDSCEAAIKLARHYTSKTKILTVGGYHGFHDWYVASTPRNNGIPKVMQEWVISQNYNDIEVLEKTINEYHSEIAAVIMEPFINFLPASDYLRRIRELTERFKIILIFDEMKTGFRLSKGGGQEYFGVTPDLAIFGKALSNGFPLSALVGKRYLMKQFEEENMFYSASYATEKCSLKAALKTLEILERDNVLSHVWEMGKVLETGIRNIIIKYDLGSYLQLVGLPPMLHIIFHEVNGMTRSLMLSFLQQECVKRGVLFVGYHHTSYAHQLEDIEITLKVYDEVFELLSIAISEGILIQKLEGKAIGAFGVRDYSRKK